MSPTNKRRRRRRRSRAKTYPTLAAYLEHSGDTQTQLARALRLTQSYISRVAAGRLSPSPRRAQLLANYTNVPFESFYRVILEKRGTAA